MENKKEKSKNFIFKTLKGMTYGLFASLIIGTIISQLGFFIGKNWFGRLLEDNVGFVLKASMGFAIGVGIGYVLKLDLLKTITSGLIGGIATSFKLDLKNKTFYKPVIGLNLDPLSTYLIIVFAILLLNLIFRKKTPLDILLIPLMGVILAISLTYLISGPIGFIIGLIGKFINQATKQVPIVMVILISVSMGIILTTPISSAAISYIIFLGNNPVAALAALIGCSTQMIGFAVQAKKENKLGKVLSIGFGTSMLMFPNILKKPKIWLPTIITSIILAPFLLLFKFPYTASAFTSKALTVGAGMGTCGLVGPIQAFIGIGFNGSIFLMIVTLVIVGPGYLVFFFDWLFRKLKVYESKDLKI